jgi:hypothetical protein
VVRRVVRVGHAPGVHELDEETATLAMDGVGDRPPARHMGVGVDAGGGEVALPIVRGVRARGGDLADAGALRVVGGRGRLGRAVHLGTRTGHGCHDQAIRQRIAAHADAAEQRARAGSRVELSQEGKFFHASSSLEGMVRILD